MTFQLIKRSRWSSARSTTALVLAVAALTSGCTRRITRSGPPDLFGAVAARPAARKGASVARSAAKTTQTPDESLRELFRQQARGAFNPLTDDRRVRLFQTRLQLDPQDLAARLGLAGIYESYRLYEEAFDQYTEVLNLASRSGGFSSGGTGAGPGSSLVAPALPVPSAVEGSAAEGSKAEPPAEKAALGLARSARGAGRSAEAIPVLAAFGKRSPAASVWNELGLLYDETGDRVAAEQAFRKALVLDPNSDRAHNNLGYNLLLQNKSEAAEAEFRRALESNPKSATSRNNLGAILARRGELETARQQFRLAAADAATAHNNLAVILLEIGEYERSREELVKALTARHYFAPALTNFKLVQDLLRQRAELITAGGRLPLNSAHIPPTLALAARVEQPVTLHPPATEREAGIESNVPNIPEDRP